VLFHTETDEHRTATLRSLLRAEIEMDRFQGAREEALKVCEALCPHKLFHA